jgi:hypothetical protein
LTPCFQPSVVRLELHLGRAALDFFHACRRLFVQP